MSENESANETLQRNFMIAQQIRHRGISHETVIQAMAQLPRHLFIPPQNRGDAYLDQPVSIGHNQTISQPYIVALMTEKLLIESHNIVLEIGTGCGYQTAILAQLAKKVFTIERLEPLAQMARHTLSNLNFNNIEFHIGDGSQGWPRPLTENPHQPPLFDRILVAAAAESVPTALIDQLKENGKMVIPIGPGSDQQLLLIEKKNQQIRKSTICYCRFVRLIQD
ncbi:MAG: protein-L-isoaspartate(D-aspartate) O-methyltransferase [Sedimentisphaerales bacterium]|nr:protein-L-isoaspartate(D-aspartate) O-methyltransferase [Sedimentisphaerales bacterium]